MPNDAVSLVTTGIGVSVLAGILSGVCYVISYGFGPSKRYVFCCIQYSDNVQGGLICFAFSR